MSLRYSPLKTWLLESHFQANILFLLQGIEQLRCGSCSLWSNFCSDQKVRIRAQPTIDNNFYGTQSGWRFQFLPNDMVEIQKIVIRCETYLHVQTEGNIRAHICWPDELSYTRCKNIPSIQI